MSETNTAQSQEAALAELMDPKPDLAAAEIAQQQMPTIAQPAVNVPAVVKDRMIIEAGKDVIGIVPTTLDEAWKMSVAFVRAGMVPESYRGTGDEETTAKIMMGVLKGLEVGLPPVSAISTIMIINQRPSIWGDGALALVQKSGKLEYIIETLEGTAFQKDWTAVCVMKRVGQPEYKRTFSFAEAEKGGLTNKGPWKQYPQRMLQMRARAWGMRDGFADVLNGLAIAEEARDITPAEVKPVDTSSLDDDTTTQTPEE